MIRARAWTWVSASFLGAAVAVSACSAAGNRVGVGGTKGAGTSGTTGAGGGGVTVGAGAATAGTGGGTASGLVGPSSASGTPSSSGTTATTGVSSSAGTGGSVGANCTAQSPDLVGCPCNSAGMTRACYPANANPNTRNVGTCVDGTQTCAGGSEVTAWGACMGAVTPTTENCTDGLDHNCDGQVGCQDPTCASDPACNGACNDGDTRSCYDGPPGTENTGTCVPGTQTCINGQWQTGCPGEVLPTMEVCSDLLDHNCNGLPGCFDFFACLGDPACMPPPCMPANGCTCPTGTGDAATCPDGNYGDPTTGLCCPCSAGTCDQLGCCGEPECAGAAGCSGLVCNGLAASCNGMVNVDCDWEDLSTADATNPPEDCDQPCCKCYPTLCP